jgi:hypothetical protein
MEFKVKVLDFGVPTSAGYIYTKEVVDKAIEARELSEKFTPGNIGNNGDSVSLQDTSHLYKLSHDGTTLYADIKTVPNLEQGALFEGLVKEIGLDNLKFGIRGIGHVDNMVISNLQIIDVSVVNLP